MKKIVSLILVLGMCVSLCACSGKNSGVPQRQIERDMYPQGEEFTVEECLHDVDSDMHEDTVTVKYRCKEEYVTTHYSITSMYQYDKSTDIWTKIPDCDTKDYNYTLSDSLRGKLFAGENGTWDCLYYSVVVEEIEAMDAWIRVSYNISYGVGGPYKGEAVFEYGKFSVWVEDGDFSITFDGQEGFAVYRR